MTYQYLSSNIRFYRLARGLTQRNLAKRAGAPLSQVLLSRLENGLRTATPNNIRLLATALKVPEVSLLRRPRTVNRETWPVQLADLGSSAPRRLRKRTVGNQPPAPPVQ